MREPQAERRPGPHILFELTTQAEWPVYNLHSRGRKPHQICLDGCQMWNRCAEMEDIMSPLFPLSHVTMMTKEPWSGWCDYAEGDSHCGDSCAVSIILQWLHEAHSSGAVPFMHHDALYRCMLVTVFCMTISRNWICMALLLIRTYMYCNDLHWNHTSWKRANLQCF